MKGEKIYEYDLNVTGVTDYGVTLQSILPGQSRVPPQGARIDDDFHVAAARGQSADWFRNILADPCVELRGKSRRFQGRAEPVTDPQRIADFLEYRPERHPKMVGIILRSDGLPDRPNRAQLEEYARRLAMVIIHPEQEGK
jgi:hypothetical protein